MLPENLSQMASNTIFDWANKGRGPCDPCAIDVIDAKLVEL